MTNQKIVDYVINTPNNTNPVILKQMLEDVAGSGSLELDTTLSIAGKAADAKAVGDAIDKISGGNADGKAIIDVIELPTENIREDVFYRIPSGSVILDQMVLNTYTVHFVENLPETGLPATNLDQTEGNIYYTVNDGECWGYVDEILSSGLGVPAGWYPGATLLGALGLEYSGVITNILDDPVDGAVRILLGYVVYDHKNGNWTSFKSIGIAGTGVNAEIFNNPNNEASGMFAHAEGNQTSALGHSAHCEGHWTTAASNAQHVQGRNNIIDRDGKYAHIVGNGLGEDLSLASNAHTLDWDGNAWFAKNVFVGGAGQDDPNAVQLATMNEVGVTSWNDLTDKPFYTEKIADKTIFTHEEIFAVEPVDVGTFVGVDYCPAYKFSDTYLDVDSLCKIKITDVIENGVSFNCWIQSVTSFPEMNITIASMNSAALGSIQKSIMGIASVGDDSIYQKGLYFVPLYAATDGQVELQLQITIEIPQEKYHQLSEEYISGIFITRITNKDDILISDKTYSEIKTHAEQGDVCIALMPDGAVLNYCMDNGYSIEFGGMVKKFINDDLSILKLCTLSVNADDNSGRAFLRSSNVFYTSYGLTLKCSYDDTYFGIAVDQEGKLYTQKINTIG